MSTSEHYIEAANLSDAWIRAAQLFTKPGRKEIAPVTVTFAGVSTTQIQETKKTRNSLDAYLAAGKGLQTVETVANTIFPVALWNRALPRAAIFRRYEQILPRLHSASKENRRGLYFERMTTGGPQGAENQLNFALTEYTARKGVRRSVLQIGIFQPARDHSASALLGFPCLQHVVFTPTPSGLTVCGFYATQYLVERAYGNYLGLARLGQFVAHELGCELHRVTCMAGLLELDGNKAPLRALLSSCQAP
jgi:hypothetical protein